MQINTLFYRPRHRRGIDWAALYARSGRRLNWWQSCLVGSFSGLLMGLVVAACFLR